MSIYNNWMESLETFKDFSKKATFQSPLGLVVTPGDATEYSIDIKYRGNPKQHIQLSKMEALWLADKIKEIYE